MRLPKAFRFDGDEVLIERRGEEVILKPKPKAKFKTLSDVARYLDEKFPGETDFPDPPPRPREHERPILEW